jgi:hypothetical protein
VTAPRYLHHFTGTWREDATGILGAINDFVVIIIVVIIVLVLSE